ncbi:DUF4188 domain-containing protein [Arenibaculum sp.]|jgi:hypothetical protein|uniref:DUF4188 domain-containing protein n=1 Tax=Arenibaculum sp. TaxID=2865862 RepID=UPI002E139B7F|nr:DUF4188 domain-containing protein [Arenibaculum sp.]
MADAAVRRMTVEYDRDFVVFLIGMRINQPWKVHLWLPVMRAMRRMLAELRDRPDSGFLGHEQSGFLSVQYWRSLDDLVAYARARDGRHWPAWVDFNRRIGYSGGAVGIWHETYEVAAGRYEAIYGNMPAYGLGKVGRLVPAVGRMSDAHGRIGRAPDGAGTP